MLPVGDLDVLVSVIALNVRVLGGRHMVHCAVGRKCYLTLAMCSYTIFKKLSFESGEHR